MEFTLLGPVEATAGGRSVDLGRRRERLLLVHLLLDVGRTIPTERLIELLWDDDPPAEPRKTLHVHIARLRRALTKADDGAALVSATSGYALATPPESVDVHRFDALVARARDLADPAERASLLRKALSLWQGEPVADLGATTRIDAIRARLNERRMDAVELRVEADLDAGLHQELVTELDELTTEHPDRERLIGVRMLALYRSGRKTDALRVYAQAAERLADELGVDPGQRLQELHLAMLRDSDELTTPAEPRSPAPRGHPAELPADVPTFTGRTAELDRLIESCRAATSVVIGVIDGMAGVGKTAFAVRAAHLLEPSYPDGQMFVDLRGFSEDAAPVTALDTLGRMLRSLGIPDEHIPADEAERGTLYRSTLADRRVLIVLDNAASTEQVEALLPAGRGCLVLITSRRRLTDLDPTASISLEVMPPDDARALIRQIVGEQRVGDEPDGLLDELADFCGRLPLAIRLAAGRLRARPTWTLRYLIERLRDQRDRLGELRTGHRGVESVFRLSYEHLEPDQQRLFRLLGLYPGRDFDVLAASALCGLEPEHTDRVLNELFDVHLLQQDKPGRYHLHDLLHEFAAKVATSDDEAERVVAAVRLFDWYLHTLAVTVEFTGKEKAPIPLDDTTPAAPLPALRDFDEAIAWLDRERQNLIAAVHRARTLGLNTHVWRFARGLHPFFYIRGHNEDWVVTHRIALDATREDRDRYAEAATSNRLGMALWRSADGNEAVGHLERAVALWRELDRPVNEGKALNNLGIACWQSGRPAEAIEHMERSRELNARLGDQDGEATAAGNLGRAYTTTGRYDLALERLQRSLELYDQFQDNSGRADTLTNLGRLHIWRGSYEEALTILSEALEIERRLGHRSGEAEANNGLGLAYTRMGRPDDGLGCHERALVLSRQIGNRELEAESLNGIGEAYARSGTPSEALAYHRQALGLVETGGARDEVARSHHGIGRALLGEGENDAQAREHLEHAHRIYDDLGAAETEDVTADLGRCGG